MPELLGRLNMNSQLSTASGVESGPDQAGFDSRPQPIDQRKIGLCEEVQRWGERIVCSAFQGQVRLAIGEK